MPHERVQLWVCLFLHGCFLAPRSEGAVWEALICVTLTYSNGAVETVCLELAKERLGESLGQSCTCVGGPLSHCTCRVRGVVRQAASQKVPDYEVLGVCPSDRGTVHILLLSFRSPR